MAASEELGFKPDGLTPNDIEKLKSIISKYFKVYDIRWSENTAAFYFNYISYELEEHFENLRLTLREKGYIPRLTQEGGEHIIYIIRSPIIKKRNIWINVFLIILTFITTTWAGAILWFGRINPGYEYVNEYVDPVVLPLLSGNSVLFGFLSFAVPLMIILGTHETAHYLASKKHNVDASLPYFIPVPPPFILGTMGAFISMREPIPNKKALLDIGAAGPIAGFIVSIPILIIGFLLEGIQPVTYTELPSQVYVFNEPLLFYGLRFFFPSPENSIMHPTAFAGWVGLFVTALNLIPGGQLDGGHIARALFGENAKYLSMIVIVILFILSFATAFFLWIFFAFIILMLGTSHPPPLNDISPLGGKRRAIGAFCIVMLVLCIHYAPVSIITTPNYDLEFECDECSKVVDINGSTSYLINVTNIGEADGDAKFEFNASTNEANESDWITEVELRTSEGDPIPETNWHKFKLKKSAHFQIIVNIRANQNLQYGDNITHGLNVTLTGMKKHTESLNLHTHVGTFNLKTDKTYDSVDPGDINRNQIQVENLLNQTETIDFGIDFTPPTKDIGWNVTYPLSVQLGPKERLEITIYITTPFNVKSGTLIELELRGTSQTTNNSYDSIKLLIEVK